MEKTEISEKLEKMATALELLGENQFKVRAIRNAAEILASTSENLCDVASGKTKVKGIGSGIQGLLKEFLETGTAKEFKEVTQKVRPIVYELMQVSGLGPKKAMLLHQELGIESLGELEYACRENRLSELKGFGSAIQKKILEDLEKKQAMKGKLRLDQALEVAEEIEKIFSPEKIYPVGELARTLPICSTLEFLVVGLDLTELKKKLKKMDWVSEPGFSKQTSASGVLLFLGKEIDVRFWLSAKDQQSEVNQQIYEQTVADKDILKKAAAESWSLAWLEDETLRRLSKSKSKPHWYQRKKHGSVRGVFHCHTTASDGTASLEQMVKQAQELGYEYIGVSDHSQSAFYARGLKEDQVFKQREEVLKLQKKFKIKIFHGIESDILADGKLDYSNAVLKEFDFVIGSIHSRFQMSKEQMTERLIQALSHPLIHFWGHPTGRLLLARDGYSLDWEQCLQAAAKNKVCVELNSNPQRLDLDWSLGAQIEEKQIQISINPDAHSVEGLSDTRFGEMMAEKAGIDPSLILNLKRLDQIEEFLA